jgi:hypothetical protein
MREKNEAAENMGRLGFAPGMITIEPGFWNKMEIVDVEKEPERKRPSDIAQEERE